MRFGRFFGAARASGAGERAARERVKAWALAALASAPGASVTVSEIVCTDPSCPGVETIVLVMAPGEKTRAVKVGKSIEAVTEQDIRDALV